MDGITQANTHLSANEMGKREEYSRQPSRLLHFFVYLFLSLLFRTRPSPKSHLSRAGISFSFLCFSTFWFRCLSFSFYEFIPFALSSKLSSFPGQESSRRRGWRVCTCPPRNCVIPSAACIQVALFLVHLMHIYIYLSYIYTRIVKVGFTSRLREINTRVLHSRIRCQYILTYK